MRICCTGIDPGLVDTGILCLEFDTSHQHIYRGINVVTRGTGANIADGVAQMWASGFREDGPLWIEAYRPRHRLNSDDRMVKLVQAIHLELPGSKVLPNTGIKKVIKPTLLNLLDCSAKQLPSTHHGDLVSAARILLLGMFKDPKLNTLIADIVRDHMNGVTWGITYI